ncbi:helix-turn-helix transcriptional regulator [Actinoallomurus spadix]|uniref:Helix-turn-helix transcriptional regulator n=1 Tax=Actinoallomurus spadix TaxID=79912 RepID=A0ABN0XPS7_9ACTN|nr:helix-turn-helix transcriptional regulator [Actinoallomurus spadix]MCO5988387.1 helix-turn-helix transcriptional regulator [Actinoallomurus spadix]
MGRPAKQLRPGDSPVTYFGYELRKHRESEQLTQDQLAAELRWTRPIVSMLELAERIPRQHHAEALDARFRTDRFGHLYELIKKEAVPSFFRGYVERERTADQVRAHAPLLIPGLLQTEGYATAVLRAGRSPGELERSVAARLERQRILFRDDPAPARLWALIDETALRRQVGGPDVMAAQLGHLLEVSDRYNVTLQVVPESAQTYAGLEGAFTILGFQDGADIAYVDAVRGGYLVDQQARVREITLTWDLVRTSALPGDDSLLKIKEYL